MTPHARPHIETHSRGRGHSAVAGAAYRLGVALLDARTGTRHAYARRRRRGEVVAAFTIAPDGAPAWATDPAQCWNRAEAAEKRKDAQVARDYRMPVPLGLDDQAAAAMAREMAEHIAARFAVPVSVGVHRDNPRDALGREKPADRRGFHAHLYFPTRRLDGDDFGAKLSELSNKTTSAPLVDALNERWAALANTYTTRAGLMADYDHRAHARAGDGDEPMPTLGVAACAMERRGITTDKGDDMKMMERLRALLPAAPNADTETTSEPTTTEQGGGQASGGASTQHDATAWTVHAQRYRARKALRRAEQDEAERVAAYEAAHAEAERRRARLAQWLAKHPRPWWMFWRRRKVWATTRDRLDAATARQQQREQAAQRATEEARRAVKKARAEVERTNRLETPKAAEPLVRVWKPERPTPTSEPTPPTVKPSTPPAVPGALARRLGLLPHDARAAQPETPRTRKRRGPK